MPPKKKQTKIKTHDYDKHASKYAELGIDDTNYLAFRDIPQLIQKHANGLAALDYGCGAGRSTRFLKNLGLDVVITGGAVSGYCLFQHILINVDPYNLQP